MMNTRPRVLGLLTAALTTCVVGQTFGDLLLYEPFNYTVGENLGGTDPDGAGPTAGTPVGQTNVNTGGGTWYVRGTQSDYQSPEDTVVSAGNLSYAGLATGQGNSVSYGSAAGGINLYSDSIDLPGDPITSGALYASFIIRLKSNVNGAGSTFRFSPASFVTDTSDAVTAGTALGGASGTAIPTPVLWVRRDPVIVGQSNLGVGKSSGDGIGFGAVGPSAGWQISDPNFNGGTHHESNLFGNLFGQTAPDINTPASYQTYFVVMKYEFDAQTPDSGNNNQADTVSIWINPGSGTLGTATGEADASQTAVGNLGSYVGATDAFGGATSDSAEIESFALIGHRQNQDQSIAVDFDELRVGTMWSDVTPTAAAPADDADFDGDGDVDGADFLTWQRNLGGNGGLAQGDANNSGTITGADLTVWRSQFGPAATAAVGAIPEPATALLALAGVLGFAALRRRLN